MINRVLIRTKVVQLLYSYLLVEDKFKLESQPASPTKEKRFAYSLYLDVLYLMTRIAGNMTIKGKPGPLTDTRFIKRLTSDEHIRSLDYKYAAGGFPFVSVISPLSDLLKESGLYKNFRKREDLGSMAAESIWRDIFNLIIMTHPEVNKIISSMPNYSLGGVDRMRKMIEETFVNFFASGDHLPDALHELSNSLETARDLYFRLLYLPVELTQLRQNDIDEALHKYVLSDEDKNPNMRLVDNELVKLIATNTKICQYMKDDNKWLPADEPMLRTLLKAIMASDIYQEYLNLPVTDMHTDTELWRNLFKHVIFCNPVFLETLEDKSVFWNDDLEIMGTFMLKTLKRFGEGVTDPIYDKYKDEEDARFGAELFTAVVKNKEDYRHLIDEVNDKNTWETERLAYMDVVILMTAVAEMLNFPKIPLNVTINEYIEIAKSYSTPKSAQFVHGLLSDICVRLRQDGKLFKN
ncbi:MAG: transcription antitermination protein NusB [Muribaculaceae bacterium]|nr:transcription antitermination protein NusB [Muribaculaceae bacterium]